MMRVESGCEVQHREPRGRPGMAEGIMVRRNKLLIIMRHGPKDDKGNLTGEGRTEMAKRAEALKPLLVGKTIVIYSSPVKRVKESAEIVARALGIPEVKEDILLHEDSEGLEAMMMLDKVRSQGDEDACVLMTHSPVAKSFKVILGDAWTKTDIDGTFTATIEMKAE
ncbi:MAG: histidine phosphatase family protein [Candidatus ainarchaeum sp.]|nr:histidine phosphatase family protein [Candidatus ainarchaeum sp.]